MIGALLAVVLFSAPAPDSLGDDVAFVAYNRYPKHDRTIPSKFEGEDVSHRVFSRLLDMWGCKPLGPSDGAWMVDTPFTFPVATVAAACDSLPLSRELFEMPQEELMPDNRGVWRSYLLVLRGGVEVVPASLVLTTRRGQCIELERRK